MMKCGIMAYGVLRLVHWPTFVFFFHSVYISKSSASEAMYSSCTYVVYMWKKNQKHFYRLLYGTFGNATKEGEENSRAIVFHRKSVLMRLIFIRTHFISIHTRDHTEYNICVIRVFTRVFPAYMCVTAFSPDIYGHAFTISIYVI